MSGGVDSSVSAAILKRQGYDVTGVFIKVWEPDWMECTSKDDRKDAMRVAVQLDIPFLTLDLSEEYKQGVVDYMIAEYKKGKTPNPDIMCNHFVKFGAFFDFALSHGGYYVATGHYARVDRLDEGKGRIFSNLLSGVDKNKDQSYFLWTLSSYELSRILFPIGHFEKSEVRELAKKYKLQNADKKDSQGLCFIGKVDIKEFLSHYVESKKGDVLNGEGKVIGHHDGAVFFTIGKRHGFTITEKGDKDEPYYIISKDMTANTITVSHKNSSGGLKGEKKELSLIKTNWILKKPEIGRGYSARVRHLGELLSCTLASIDNSESEFVFDEPQALAQGQSVVMYDGDICLGGGVVN